MLLCLDVTLTRKSCGIYTGIADCLLQFSLVCVRFPVDISLLTCPHSMWSRVYVCPSVSLSDRLTEVCGGFATECSMHSKYQSIAGDGAQQQMQAVSTAEG